MQQLSRPRRSRKRAMTAAVCLLTVGLTAGACSVANSGSSDNALRVVLPQEPPTLEPCDANLQATGVVVRSNITEPLVEQNPETGALEPLLATKWERTSDNQWQLTLRKNVTFHDGSAFTAKDAVFSVNRVMDAPVACDVTGYIFSTSELTTKATGKFQLTVTTKKPDPILPLRLSFVEMMSTSADTEKKVREPIGTGPYKIGKWTAGERLVVDEYAEYWGAQPAYPTVQYQWRTEASVRAAMVANGEAEIARKLRPQDLKGDAVKYPNNETTALRLDGSEAPLSDIRVRKAVNYAINRKALVKDLYKGLGESASQLAPPSVIGFDENLNSWPYNPDKARQLVQEAKADGVPVDRPITLVVRTAQFLRVSETAQAISEWMRQAGLNVKIQTMGTAQHLEYQTRPYPKDAGAVALLMMHGNQGGDASFTIDPYMLSDAIMSTFGTAKFDAMIAEAEKVSGKARDDALAEVIAYQNEHIVQYANLTHMRGVLGVAPTVQYQPNAQTTNEMRLAEIKPANQQDA